MNQRLLFCILALSVVLVLACGTTASVTPSSEVASATDQSARAIASPTSGVRAATATAQPTAKPTAAPLGPAKVGERVQSGGVALTINKVSFTNKLSLASPKAGNRYLVVDTTVENVERNEATPYNPMYFKVQDADGFEYSSALLAPDPTLKSGELKKGERARGNIAFEVPTKATGFNVSYKPLVLFGGYQVIKVDLSQTASNVSQPTSASQPTGRVSKVAERVVSAGIGFTVNSVSFATSVGSVFKASANNTYAILDVTIENASRDEELPYNPLYFKIKDDKDFEYNSTLVGAEPTLKAGELAKGQKARGKVTFEVPASAKTLVVSYKPMVLFADYEVIQVKVK